MWYFFQKLVVGLVILTALFFYVFADPDSEPTSENELQFKKEEKISRASQLLEKQKALEELPKRIKKCMFENVGKVTNEITERIVREECTQRTIDQSDWSSKLKEIIREIKKKDVN